MGVNGKTVVIHLDREVPTYACGMSHSHLRYCDENIGEELSHRVFDIKVKRLMHCRYNPRKDISELHGNCIVT